MCGFAPHCLGQVSTLLKARTLLPQVFVSGTEISLHLLLFPSHPHYTVNMALSWDLRFQGFSSTNDGEEGNKTRLDFKLLVCVMYLDNYMRQGGECGK